MATFGLVVEGNYDEAALKEFVQKCASSDVDIMCRRCGNAPQLMKRFPGFLEEFRHGKEGSDVDKAMVVRDADRKNPAELIGRMQSKISNRNYRFPVKLLVIVEELEAWFLADEAAISAVTGRKPRVTRNPENLSNPKERLRKLLSDANIGYTHEIARKLAAGARVEVLTARCPSFKKFYEAITDC